MAERVDPSVTAAMDQAGAFMGNMANLLGQFFDALLDNGFEREEAMTLVRDYFADLEEAQGEDG